MSHDAATSGPRIALRVVNDDLGEFGGVVRAHGFDIAYPLKEAVPLPAASEVVWVLSELRDWTKFAADLIVALAAWKSIRGPRPVFIPDPNGTWINLSEVAQEAARRAVIDALQVSVADLDRFTETDTAESDGALHGPLPWETEEAPLFVGSGDPWIAAPLARINHMNGDYIATIRLREAEREFTVERATGDLPAVGDPVTLFRGEAETSELGVIVIVITERDQSDQGVFIFAKYGDPEYDAILARHR